MTVLDLASDIDETYITHGLRYMMQSSNAVMFLGLFFYSCTFVAALSVAASRQLSTAWSTYPQMDPVFPQQQQQQQQAYGNAAMPQYHYPQCQNPAPQGYPQSGA